MRIKVLSLTIISILFMGLSSVARADDDARIIGKLGQNSPKDHLRTVSFYMSFRGNKTDSLPAVPAGDNTRFYSKVWEGLYLQCTTEPGEDGISGYVLTFSRDEAGLDPINTNESRDVPTLREVSAGDFRSDDNFSVRSLKPGPGTFNDRGAWRVIHYDEFDVVIRVLEFNIGDAILKKKPYFKSFSYLVTVVEKSTDGQIK